MRTLLCFVWCFLNTPLYAGASWSIKYHDDHGALWQPQNITRHGVKSTLKVWKRRDQGRCFLYKQAAPYTVRAESVGSRLFQKLEIPSPETHLDRTNPLQPALFIEFHHHLEKLQSEDYQKHTDVWARALLADILLYNYDRHRLNIRVQDSGDLFFFDHGAGLTSKAQGHNQEYPDSVDERQILKIMTLAVNKKSPVNQGYKRFLKWSSLQQKQLVIPKVVRKSLHRALLLMKEKLTDQVIAEELVKPVFRGVRQQESRLEIRQRLSSGKNIAIAIVSRDEVRARRTLKSILHDFDGCQASYFIYAMKKRRDDILKIFGSALSKPL